MSIVKGVIVDLIKYILNLVTNFFHLISYFIKMTRNNIIDLWKNYYTK